MKNYIKLVKFLRKFAIYNALNKLLWICIQQYIINCVLNYGKQIVDSKNDLGAVHIIVRHAAPRLTINRRTNSKRPEGFKYENCLGSIVNVDNLSSDFKLTLIYDGNFEDWKDDPVFPIYRACKLKKSLIFNDVGNARETFNLALNHAVRDEQYEYVYLVENDYLHSANWVKRVQTMIESGGNIFATFYHPDYSIQKTLACKSSVPCSADDSYFWSASCIGTFLVKRKFLEDKILIFKFGGRDYEIFPLLAALGHFVKVPYSQIALHAEVGHLNFSELNYFSEAGTEW